MTEANIMRWYFPEKAITSKIFRTFGTDGFFIQ